MLEKKNFKKGGFIEKYYFSSWILVFCLLVFYFFAPNSKIALLTSVSNYKNIENIESSFEWFKYPIKYTANYDILSNNKTLDYVNLKSDEMMILPKFSEKLYFWDILSSDSWSIKNILEHKSIYDTTYLGYPWYFKNTKYSGSFPWYFINTLQNTPINSIWNWILYSIWEDNIIWKYVIIEHNSVPKYWTLYSVYWNMESIFVKNIWRKVDIWEIIWVAWKSSVFAKSWLYFQVESNSASSHPYLPFEINEITNAFDEFQKSSHKENVLKNTIDAMELF